MSYKDIAGLAQDAGFGSRLAAGLTDEARTKASDYLVDQIMTSPGVGQAWFMPFVSSAPGFGTTYADSGQLGITDAELLSAIQASWERVYQLHQPV